MSDLVQAIQPMISKGVSIPIRHEYRVKVKELDPQVRKRMFEEVEKPISVAEAFRLPITAWPLPTCTACTTGPLHPFVKRDVTEETYL